MYTDLTRACPHCLIRVRAVRRVCPTCQQDELCDAKELVTRWRALPLTRAGGPEKLPGFFALTILFVASTLMGLGALMGVSTLVPLTYYSDGSSMVTPASFVMFVLGIAAFVVTFLACLFGGVGILSGRASKALGWSHPQPRGVGIECVDSSRTPEEPEERVRGRVVAVEGSFIESPMTGRRCVAYTLAGRVGGVEVRDAFAVEFILETPDRRRVWVEAASAAVSLREGREHSVDAAARSALQTFFEARGIVSDADEVRLGEAILEAGDEVVLEGSLEAASDPHSSGYRAEVSLVARDRPQHPLTLRATGTI